MSERVLVTGGTGIIGREVVHQLISRGSCMRIGLRNLQKAETLITGRCPLVYFDYTKPETFKEAFEGITTLFITSPVNYQRMDELILPTLEYAANHGVQHIVCLGSIGVEIDSESPLLIAEKCVQGCGVDYTILKPNLLMQNFLTVVGEFIRKTGSMHLPAGDAKISFVDARDVASAAAESILNKKHINKVYSLTGGESLDHYQIASIISNVTGEKTTYIPVSHNETWAELKNVGWSDKSAELIIGLYEIARHGWCADVISDLHDILGHSPISFEQFAKDYKAAWM